MQNVKSENVSFIGYYVLSGLQGNQKGEMASKKHDEVLIQASACVITVLLSFFLSRSLNMPPTGYNRHYFSQLANNVFLNHPANVLRKSDPNKKTNITSV